MAGINLFYFYQPRLYLRSFSYLPDPDHETKARLSIIYLWGSLVDKDCWGLSSSILWILMGCLMNNYKTGIGSDNVICLIPMRPAFNPGDIREMDWTIATRGQGPASRVRSLHDKISHEWDWITTPSNLTSHPSHVDSKGLTEGFIFWFDMCLFHVEEV